MCHECEENGFFEEGYFDEEPDIEPDVEKGHVEVFDGMPDALKEELINDLAETMDYIMETAEKENVLFELITKWPRRKISMYETAVFLQKSLREDNY